jgi:hypothetical protein
VVAIASRQTCSYSTEAAVGVVQLVAAVVALASMHIGIE